MNGLRKHTLNLRDGDWDFLESVYRQHGVAVAIVVRKLVSNHVDHLRAQIDENPYDFGDLDE